MSVEEDKIVDQMLKDALEKAKKEKSKNNPKDVEKLNKKKK